MGGISDADLLTWPKPKIMGSALTLATMWLLNVILIKKLNRYMKTGGLVREYINVELFSYARALGDGPRNFERGSSDEDDTLAGTLSSNTTLPHQRGHV
ncbi:hypothetical protein TNCV_818881 [Trichonephila clavipes]|nr:hypothetical protein TNCV_818881 [Trichonephila clavipes]